MRPPFGPVTWHPATCRQPSQRPAPGWAPVGTAGGRRTRGPGAAPVPACPCLQGRRAGPPTPAPYRPPPPASVTRAWSARMREGPEPDGGPLAFPAKPWARGGALSSTCTVAGNRAACSISTRTQSSNSVEEKRHLSEGTFHSGAGQAFGGGRWRPGATCCLERGRRLASRGPRGPGAWRLGTWGGNRPEHQGRRRLGHTTF